MRVLQVNKFRRVTGGVESHLHLLESELSARGLVVRIFSSEDLSAPRFDAAATTVGSKLKTASALMWNRDARGRLAQHISQFEPDIVHLHSVYHQLSPAVLDAIPGGVPRVMTLHDYKLAAPCYLLTRDGQECQLCVGRRVSLPGVRHRCVGGSAAASAVCAVEEIVHRRRYITKVDAFIVPSEAAADVATRAGIPGKKLCVVRWGVAPAASLDGASVRRTMSFVGRLAPEKGVDVLLAAWALSRAAAAGWTLEIAGDGPLRDVVVAAAKCDRTVTYRAWLDGNLRAELMGRSAAFICPSRFPETYGLSAAEALAAGVPVLGARVGALPELVQDGVNGLLHEVGHAGQLASQIDLVALTGAGEDLRASARRTRASIPTPGMMAEGVIDVYRKFRPC
jgi:glycosyltransferase involved in cell wall biosynthesis